MRKLLLTSLASTGLVLAIAVPASAAPENEPIKANYGQCVKAGVVIPSEGVDGPTTPNVAIRSDFNGGIFTNKANENARENARFSFAEVACFPEG